MPLTAASRLNTLLTLVGAASAVAAVEVLFGVPLVGGAHVLATTAAAGAMIGALIALLLAVLRKTSKPLGLLILATAGTAAGAAWMARAPPAPAVILVVVDCLRADSFSAHRMPATHALTADGARFNRARAQSSWTRTSMPSLLTGRYPAEHGLYRMDPPERIPEDMPLLAERFQAAGWMTAAFAQQPQLDPAFGYGRGFGRYNWRDGRAHQITPKLSAWNKVFRTVPRFVLAHYLDVHAPYTPRPRFRPVGLPHSSLATHPFKAWRDTVIRIERGTLVPTADDWAFLAGLYDGEVRQLDAELDGLLDGWRADGTLDAAWVVLTSDHGERFGEHGRIAHMGPPDEAVLSVPLLIRPPGGGKRRSVNEVVELVDVVPTLISAAGLPPDPLLPGRDLTPALAGERLAERPSFAEEWASTLHHASVRIGDWKLLRGNRTELFDLSTDPGELRSVADANPDVVQRLEGTLAAYFAAAADRRPIGDVDWAAAATSGAGWTQKEVPPSDTTTLSEETREALEALGYMDE